MERRRRSRDRGVRRGGYLAKIPRAHSCDLFRSANARDDRDRSPHGPCHRGEKRGGGAVSFDRFRFARARGECGGGERRTSPTSFAHGGVRRRVWTLAGTVRPVHAHHIVSYGNILMAPVLAWILCAPKYLVGSMSLGESAQVVAAFV